MKRFGRVIELDFCRYCGATESLVRHHAYFRSCDDCRSGEQERATACRKEHHIIVLCRSCHFTVHDIRQFKRPQGAQVDAAMDRAKAGGA